MISFVALFKLLAMIAAVTASPTYPEDFVFGLDPCVDWEAGSAAYQEAYAKWKDKEPLCYNFSYTAQMWSYEDTPIVRTVYKGSSIQDGDGREYQTLADFWSMIDEWCFHDCPNSGPHSCQIDYTTSDDGFMYPASIYIDDEEMITSDETVYFIENMKAIDCAVLDDIEWGVLKPDTCWDYLAVKDSLETALLNWEDAGDCYNYTIEEQILYTGEVGSQYHIVVREGVPAMGGETNRTELNRTLSDWLAEIQEMVVDRCKAENDEDPYDTSWIQYDPVWGFPNSINYGFGGEEYYYIISDFARCEGKKAGVCADYERVKSNFYAALLAWDYMADKNCYGYTIEQKDATVEESSGTFTVLVQDGIPKVLKTPSTYNEVDGPNMTYSLEDWIVHIKEHCIEGCESDSSIEAYHNCTVTFDEYMGSPTTMLFDVDGSNKVEYVVSSFSLCDSWSTFDVEKAEYATASAKLETLLTENPCYEFTYTVLSDTAPSTEAVTVKVSQEVSENKTPIDQFSNLQDVMLFYETNCFPIMTYDAFGCKMSLDELGVPTRFLLNYDYTVANYTKSVLIDSVAFVSCGDTPQVGPSTAASVTLMYAGVLTLAAFLLK